MSCVFGYILLILTNCCPRRNNLELRNFYDLKTAASQIKITYYYSGEILFTHHIPRNTGGSGVVPGKFLGSCGILVGPRDWNGSRGSWASRGSNRSRGPRTRSHIFTKPFYSRRSHKMYQQLLSMLKLFSNEKMKLYV